jgi:hypothetical protein
MAPAVGDHMGTLTAARSPILTWSRCCFVGVASAARGTAVRSKNDLDVKEIVNLWAGGSAAVKSMLGRH